MKTSLLIGNGFNRLGAPELSSWDELIKAPLRERKLIGVENGFVDIVNMSYPLKYEYIINYIQEKTKRYDCELYVETKKTILNELDKVLSKDGWSQNKEFRELRDLLLRIEPSAVLTTNYDTLLEDVFYSKSGNYKYRQTIVDKLNNAKSMDALAILSKTATLGKKGKKVDFYHLHGIREVPESICLGYEHYTRILSLLRDKVASWKGTPRIIKYLRSNCAEPKTMINQYQSRFFDSDMYIVGLGLGEQEIDIWWLLCYRAYLFFSNLDGARDLIKNDIVYFDVHPKHFTADGYAYEPDYLKQKKALFDSMHVIYEPLFVEQKDFYTQYRIALNKIIEMKNEREAT